MAIEEQQAGGAEAAAEQKVRNPLAIVLFTVAGFCLALRLMAAVLAVSPWGSTDFDLLMIPFVLMLFACILAFPIVLFGWVLSGESRRWGSVLLGLMTIFAAFVVGEIAADRLMQRALPDIVERGQPLAEAILAYESDHGMPPDGLEHLVPDYIAEIPTTGLGSRPKFIYSHSLARDDREVRWLLSVPAGSSLMDFSTLMFCPPNRELWTCTHADRRIGDWAYKRD